VITVGTLLFIIKALGGAVDDHARHVRLAAITVLPWLFALSVDAARGPARLVRAAGVASLCLFFAVPAVYGTSVLAEKALYRTPRAKALVSREKIRLDLLGDGANAEATYNEIEAIAGGRGTVFYFTAPDLAFRLAHERLIVVHADFLTAEVLQSHTYKGMPPGGVALFLPRQFEINGKRSIIQRSFRDVANWQCVELRHAPQYLLWTSWKP